MYDLWAEIKALKVFNKIKTFLNTVLALLSFPIVIELSLMKSLV